jgi:hypothetical protein
MLNMPENAIGVSISNNVGGVYEHMGVLRIRGEWDNNASDQVSIITKEEQEMHEQEISKWGPGAIIDSVHLLIDNYFPQDSTDRTILVRACGLLGQYADSLDEAKRTDSKEKVYKALDKYMEMLPDLLDRLFPKMPERIEGDPITAPNFPVFQMPKEKWIITQDATINFSAMANHILCVENRVSQGENFTQITFQFGLDKTLSGEAATKFNELWTEEMKKRKEQGRIEIV